MDDLWPCYLGFIEGSVVVKTWICVSLNFLSQDRSRSSFLRLRLSDTTAARQQITNGESHKLAQHTSPVMIFHASTGEGGKESSRRDFEQETAILIGRCVFGTLMPI